MVVQRTALVYALSTDIGITVFTKMSAGIVLSDIDAGYAAAKLPLVAVFCNVQRPARQFRNQNIINALDMFDTQIGKINRLRAGFHFQTTRKRSSLLL